MRALDPRPNESIESKKYYGFGIIESGTRQQETEQNHISDSGALLR